MPVHLRGFPRAGAGGWRPWRTSLRPAR
jgi:hypothetical protein